MRLFGTSPFSNSPLEVRQLLLHQCQLLFGGPDAGIAALELIAELGDAAADGSPSGPGRAPGWRPAGRAAPPPAAPVPAPRAMSCCQFRRPAAAWLLSASSACSRACCASRLASWPFRIASCACTRRPSSRAITWPPLTCGRLGHLQLAQDAAFQMLHRQPVAGHVEFAGCHHRAGQLCLGGPEHQAAEQARSRRPPSTAPAGAPGSADAWAAARPGRPGWPASGRGSRPAGGVRALSCCGRAAGLIVPPGSCACSFMCRRVSAPCVSASLVRAAVLRLLRWRNGAILGSSECAGAAGPSAAPPPRSPGGPRRSGP